MLKPAGHWKCRRSHHWDSNPRRCDRLSQQSSTHRATRVLRGRGRQSLTRRLPHYSPSFYFWVVPVRLGPPPLPALTPDHSPPRPRFWPALTLTPHAWSALALNRGPPWLPIVVRLGPRFWSALTCYGHPLRNSKQEYCGPPSVRSRRRGRRFDLVPRYVLTEPGTFWPGDVGTRWRFDIDPQKRIYVKTSPGPNVTWSKRPRLGQNVPGYQVKTSTGNHVHTGRLRPCCLTGVIAH